MSILDGFVDDCPPLAIVNRTLGDKIQVAAERIKALAYCLRMGEDLDADDIDPVLDVIYDLAGGIVDQAEHASAYVYDLIEKEPKVVDPIRLEMEQAGDRHIAELRKIAAKRTAPAIAAVVVKPKRAKGGR